MSTSLYDTGNPGVSATVNAGFALQSASREAPQSVMWVRRGAWLGNSRCVATELPREHVVVLAGVTRGRVGCIGGDPGGCLMRHGEDWSPAMM